MKKLAFCIFLFLPIVLLCQPIGKLFVHTGFVTDNILGYIQYPQNQYYVLDTTDADDLKIIGNKLLISNNHIYFYDINTLSKVDSIMCDMANKIDFENEKIIITKTEPPFFEVYNLNSKNLIFSLDTDKIKSIPVDLLVDIGKVYLLFDTSIVIVDLNLQDTLGTIATVLPFWFPAYNQSFINYGDKIFIDVEIATGAPRFAIFSFDKSTWEVKNVLLKEFIDTPFEPVLVDNKIYTSTFPSYYDIIADTFIYNQDNQWTYPLAYDDNSQTIFLYKPIDFSIKYFNNNIFSNAEYIPTYLNKSIFYNEGISFIKEEQTDDFIKIFPIPARDYLNILFKNETLVRGIRVISMNGDSYIKIINNKIASQELDISQLKDGMYFVEIQFQNQIVQKKFIKASND